MRGLLIAVDFGTTFTGVAYSDPSGGPDPILFTNWPGGNADKVPTVVRRQAGNSKPAWGNLVKSGHERYEWFKLGLEPMQQAANSSVDMSAKYPSKDYVGTQLAEARELTTYFLSQLRQHVISTLRMRYGAPAFDALKIEWIVTVPAIWSLEAKNVTKECAEAAGMGSKDSLKMISEPEAAAVYALKKLEPHHLQIGHNIVVVDAGGGTVDLITYKITQLQPCLLVEESSVCTGGKCGGVFVNRVFEAMIDRKLADAAIMMNNPARFQMRKHFETFTKKEFDADEDDIEYIPVPSVPDSATASIKGGRLAVTSDELRMVFDEVLCNVIDLTLAQINGISGSTSSRQVSAVVVVGGFGESRYLQQSLRVVPQLVDIPLLLPPNAWTSIARGAVLSGGDKSRGSALVQSRVSQCSIGYGISRRWKPGDSEDRKYWCGVKGVWRTKGIFSVMVHRHEQLKENVPIRDEAHKYIRTNDELFFEERIYTSFADIPPETTKGGCKRLGVLRVELSSLPRKELKTVRGKDGKKYYSIHWVTEMTFYSANIKFEIEFNGKKYATAYLDYQTDDNYRGPPRLAGNANRLAEPRLDFEMLSLNAEPVKRRPVGPRLDEHGGEVDPFDDTLGVTELNADWLD